MLSKEEKARRAFSRKLHILQRELSVAKVVFPGDVASIEIQIHHLKMKHLGKDYLEKIEAEKELLRKNRQL